MSITRRAPAALRSGGLRPERDNIAAPVLPAAAALAQRRAPAGARRADRGRARCSSTSSTSPSSTACARCRTRSRGTERYRDAGLATLGVHSPRFRFTGERELLGAGARAARASRHPVADDSGYALWHDYGCKGWPSLFLWGQGGALRWFHFGEGEYEATERAIAAELARARPGLRGAGAAGAAAAEPTPPGRWSLRPATRSSPAAAVTEPWRPAERRGSARARLRAPAAPTPRSARLGRAAGGARRRRAATRSRSRPRASTTSPSIRATSATRSRSGRRRGSSVYSVSFSAGLP